MSNYQSKHTGQAIDDGIDATAKIPNLETSVANFPTKLPNPHALNINGTVYDGSEAKTVNIDAGDGSGTAVQYIPQDLTPEQIAQVMTNLGQGFMPIDPADLPADYPTFTVTGESPYKNDFYIVPHDNEGAENYYLSILNHKGEILKIHRVSNRSFCFRKSYNSRGEIRYSWLQTVSSEPTYGNVGFYENCVLVVVDKDFNIIDSVRLKATKYLTEGHPIENHDYIYIDDGHYVVACYYQLENSDFYENVIQEIKYNKVVFEWDTINFPELRPLSHTSQTGDYSHFNSVVFDKDGHFIISLRNIGVIKVNRTDSSIMWVIGVNRNDFSGIATSLLPFQQHDMKFVRKDGSFTIFDNFGHATMSRILKYSLDESDMSATAEEFVCTTVKSPFMGSSTLVDLENEVFDVNYGGGLNYGFEEYSFSTNKQLMSLNFDDGYDMYRVWRDVDLLYSQLIIPEMSTTVSGGETPAVVNKVQLRQEIATCEGLTQSNYTTESWEVLSTKLAEAKSVESNTDATQEEVNTATSTLTQARLSLVLAPAGDIPNPIYTLSSTTFDGTNYVDTGVKLFDTNKSFTIVTRRKYDYDAMFVDGKAMNFMNAWNEVDGWKGLQVFVKYSNEKVEINGSSDSFTQDIGQGVRNDNILTLVHDSATNKYTFKIEFLEGGDAPVFFEATVAYDPNSVFADKSLVIGAVDTDGAGGMSNYFEGLISHFAVYDKVLTDAELTAVIDTIKV